MSTEILKDIRQELRELRILYKQLIEKLIPTEEPIKEEKRGIEEQDEIADEQKLMQVLGKTHVRHKH